MPESGRSFARNCQVGSLGVGQAKWEVGRGAFVEFPSDPSEQMQMLFLCLASIAVFVRVVNPLQINAIIRKTSGRCVCAE